MVRPRGEKYVRPSNDVVMRACLSFVPYMPAPARLGLPVGLWLIEWCPLFFGFGPRRFSSLDEVDAAAYLARLLHARPPLSTTVVGLRALVLIAFYERPEVLGALGVEWQKRAEELTQRRGRLLEMPEQLANPRNAAGGTGR
ncbi:MAG: hypothetical protein D6760_07135 [Deltaproteobacteria bacterium]|nr:MAG: hypothetical protein D6760_07135 [Deltaproteobacteria bacterium]